MPETPPRLADLVRGLCAHAGDDPRDCPDCTDLVERLAPLLPPADATPAPSPALAALLAEAERAAALLQSLWESGNGPHGQPQIGANLDQVILAQSMLREMAAALRAASPSHAAAVEGDTADCDDCHAPYGEDGWCDVVIPNEIWNAIAPSGGILCFRCMTKRLQAAGYDDTNPVPVIVASGPYRDANEEWRLIGWEHGHAIGVEESSASQATAVEAAYREGYERCFRRRVDSVFDADDTRDLDDDWLASAARRTLSLAPETLSGTTPPRAADEEG